MTNINVEVPICALPQGSFHLTLFSRGNGRSGPIPIDSVSHVDEGEGNSSGCIVVVYNRQLYSTYEPNSKSTGVGRGKASRYANLSAKSMIRDRRVAIGDDVEVEVEAEGILNCLC